jgi:hypothetical protein
LSLLEQAYHSERPKDLTSELLSLDDLSEPRPIIQVGDFTNQSVRRHNLSIWPCGLQEVSWLLAHIAIGQSALADINSQDLTLSSVVSR